MFNKLRNGTIQTKKQMRYFNKGNLCHNFLAQTFLHDVEKNPKIS